MLLDVFLPVLIFSSYFLWDPHFNNSRPTSKMTLPQSIGKQIKFYIKGFFALGLLLTSATYGVLCSLFFSAIGKRDLAQWSTARFYYNLFSSVMRINIEIENQERLNGLPAILISNHQSELDILVLGRIFPKRCVVTAKKQLKLIPFLGWFMALSGTFFLDRANHEKAIRVLNNALDNLKETNGGLFMFPEGTRSYSSKPTLLPFKKGAFHLAVQAQIPIIPVVVSNTSNLYSLKLKNFNTGTIKIKVLEPISTEGLTKEDVPKLVEATQASMESELLSIGMSVVKGEKVVGEAEALLPHEAQ